MRRGFPIIALLFSGLLAFPVHAGPIEKLRAFIEQTRSARAIFTQTVADSSGQISQPSLQLAQAGTRGLSFDNYIRLKKGMSEGELLSRAGTPDHKTIDGVSDSDDAVEIARTYYYYATAEDPFITTIKVLGGKVIDIKRERQF